MKQVKKKMMLGSMAMLMGAGVVVGGGALQEPVVQTAEAKSDYGQYVSTRYSMIIYDYKKMTQGKYVKVGKMYENRKFRVVGTIGDYRTVMMNGKLYSIHYKAIQLGAKRI